MNEPAPPVATKSNGVTTVAVANFILGAARIVLSVLILWYMFETMFEGPDPKADILTFLGFLALVIVWPLLFMIGIVSIVAGIVLIVAGMGLLRRSPWSRVVTLVLGGMGGGLAALYGQQLYGQLTEAWTPVGVGISLAGVIVHGGYCALVFIVLMNRRNAAEFVN